MLNNNAACCTAATAAVVRLPTLGCESSVSGTAAVSVLTPADTVSISSLQSNPSVCVKEVGADDASRVLRFSVASSSGSPFNISSINNLLCDGTVEPGSSRRSISPSGAPTTNRECRLK
jgi:hypothetical protein